MYFFLTLHMEVLSLYTIFVLKYCVFTHGELVESVCTVFDMAHEYIQIFDKNETLCYHDELSTANVSKHMNYWLYTRERREGQLFDPSIPDMMKETTLNATNPVKVLVHGWRGELVGKNSVCENLMKAYLHVGEYNVICVQWKRFLFDLNYLNAKLRVKSVGYNIAKVLKVISKRMRNGFEDMHLIGHSLGAHIVGFAGKKLKNQIPRITGLDPAKPLYRLSGPHNRIDKTDAKFVDIVHTNGKILGLLSPVGHIDFYPNGGKRQPQFKLDDLVTAGARSHLSSIHYFAQSILVKNVFMAIKCSNWKEFEDENCGYPVSITYMGEYVNQTHTGSYYLTVAEPLI